MSTSTLLRRFVLALCLTAAGLTASSAGANPNQKPTVHLVAIGDLDVGSDFGQKVLEDAQNTIATFERAFAKAGKMEQLKTHLLQGEEVNPKYVLNVIAKLEVGKDDTLVVLFPDTAALGRIASIT